MLKRVRRTLRATKRFVKEVKNVWVQPPLTEAEAFNLDSFLHDHPPDMSVCTCPAKASDRNAFLLDHSPDCKWEQDRCESCCGSGHCSSCGGDGRGISITREDIEGMPWGHVLPASHPDSNYYRPSSPEHHDAVSDDLGASESIETPEDEGSLLFRAWEGAKRDIALITPAQRRVFEANAEIRRRRSTQE